MKKQTKVPVPTAEDVNLWIDVLLSEAPLGRESEYYAEATRAFENLTFCFAHRRFASNSQFLPRFLNAIHIDYIALTAMLKRFQRDAFGVARFDALTDKLVQEKQLTKALKDHLVSEVSALGLRIASKLPRKTRIPAAFSLWMCVFRPISVDAAQVPEVPEDALAQIAAMVNFFITKSYLQKYGYVELGHSPQEEQVRLDRVRHDFTVRSVTFSSLETFYSSIFRLKPEYAEHSNG